MIHYKKNMKNKKQKTKNKIERWLKKVEEPSEQVIKYQTILLMLIVVIVVWSIVSDLVKTLSIQEPISYVVVQENQGIWKEFLSKKTDNDDDQVNNQINNQGEKAGEITNLGTAAFLQRLVNNVFGNDAKIAFAIAKSESGLRNVKGDIPLEYEYQGKIIGHSCGIFQIRVLPGRPSCDELMDIETNVRYAKKVYESRKRIDGIGWTAWTNYQNGRYLAFMEE